MRESQKGRGRRKDTSKGSPRVGHSAKIEQELKTEIETAAPLRGHTPSEATELIIKLGLPHYKKTYKPKFAPAS